MIWTAKRQLLKPSLISDCSAAVHSRKWPYHLHGGRAYACAWTNGEPRENNSAAYGSRIRGRHSKRAWAYSRCLASMTIPSASSMRDTWTRLTSFKLSSTTVNFSSFSLAYSLAYPSALIPSTGHSTHLLIRLSLSSSRYDLSIIPQALHYFPQSLHLLLTCFSSNGRAGRLVFSLSFFLRLSRFRFSRFLSSSPSGPSPMMILLLLHDGLSGRLKTQRLLLQGSKDRRFSGPADLLLIIISRGGKLDA